MENKKIRPPFALIIIAIFLAIWGFAYNSLILISIPKETLVKNIILAGIPFISYFVAILLVYIFIINVASQILSYRISEKVYNPVIAAIIAGIVIGVVMMFQPFAKAAYMPGFLVLLISLLLFMVWSHITPRK